jgi:hypothetical protein
VVQGQSRQKVLEFPSQPIKAGHGGHACHVSCAGSVNRTASPRHPCKILLKQQPKQKRIGNVPNVALHLPNEGKASVQIPVL